MVAIIIKNNKKLLIHQCVIKIEGNKLENSCKNNLLHITTITYQQNKASFYISSLLSFS